MNEIDGTPNKALAILGAKAILGVSMACCRCRCRTTFVQMVRPVPCFNVINGGVHTGNQLAPQEFFFFATGVCKSVPATFKFTEAMKMGSETYHTLKGLLKAKYGIDSTAVGDKGGFAPNISDPASSEWYNKDLAKYYLDCKKDGETAADRLLSREELVEKWVGWCACAKYPFKLVQKGIDCKTLPRVTKWDLSEAIDSFDLCVSHKWGVLVSHRSGETEDAFIADLTITLGAGDLETGTPCRSEGVAKYNSLLRIEEEL
eukprot:Awhi_evm1s12990